MCTYALYLTKKKILERAKRRTFHSSSNFLYQLIKNSLHLHRETFEFEGGNKWRRDEAGKVFVQCIDQFLETDKLFKSNQDI